MTVPKSTSLEEENIALKEKVAQLIEENHQYQIQLRENISGTDFVSYGGVFWQRTKSIDPKIPYCPRCKSAMLPTGIPLSFRCESRSCAVHIMIPQQVFDDLENFG